MTEKELKKLNRQELLEMLIFQIKKNERLQKRLDETKQKLQEREITIEESGSLAEAVLKLNGVFEAAQNAADQYLENIKLRMEQYEKTVSDLETQDETSQTTYEEDKNSINTETETPKSDNENTPQHNCSETEQTDKNIN